MMKGGLESDRKWNVMNIILKQEIGMLIWLHTSEVTIHICKKFKLNVTKKLHFEIVTLPIFDTPRFHEPNLAENVN